MQTVRQCQVCPPQVAYFRGSPPPPWLKEAAVEFDSHIYGDHRDREPSAFDADFHFCILNERRETAFRRLLGEGFATSSGLPLILVRMFVYEALINVQSHAYEDEECGPVTISVIAQRDHHKLSIKNYGKSIPQASPFSRGNGMHTLLEHFERLNAKLEALWPPVISPHTFEITLDYGHY